MGKDPRADFSAALDWAVSRVEQVSDDQLGLETPCAGWDVQELLQHCIGSAEFIVNLGQITLPDVAALGPQAGFIATAKAALATIKDDAVLDKPVDWAGGKVPGSVILATFTSEFLVHGWDVAVATGQDSEAPADLAERVLAGAKLGVPAEGRNPAAFGPVAEAPEGAGPTRQLAAWLGR
jgi:uncharacterized protein (TIGR03086 family)